MTANDIIRELKERKGFSNKTLADALGYKTTSGVSERLRGNMRVDVLAKMLEVMECEIVIRSKSDNKEWVVSE